MAAAIPFLQNVATVVGAINAINSFVDRPKTLSWNDATQQASQVLNPLFDQHLQNSLRAMDQASMARGFYGQMPADALRGERAAQIEAARSSQIADLANQMRGQSQQAALQAAQQAQSALQQQFANMMQQQQQDFSQQLSRDMFDLNKWATEAQVTGWIPGTNQPTFGVQQGLHNLALTNMANRGDTSLNVGGWGVGNVPQVRQPFGGAIVRNWNY